MSKNKTVRLALLRLLFVSFHKGRQADGIAIVEVYGFQTQSLNEKVINN